MLKNETFVVGVTGGSSTCEAGGADQLGPVRGISWPRYFERWLRSDVIGARAATVRNGARGATSQLMTAPCIRTLVGDNLDLLLWEFAMNDEYGQIFSTSRRLSDSQARRRGVYFGRQRS